MNRRRPHPDDRGFTLVEIVVSLTIMSIAMMVFTTGVLQVYRFTNRDEAAATAQSQLTVAFGRLDKEIRYAAGISTEGLVGGDPYVEYLITNTGSPLCVELRLDRAAGQLQRRTWVRGVTPLAPTAWLPLAFRVTATTPFTTRPADAVYNHQQLRVRLAVSAGAGSTAATTETDITFTALNTSVSSTDTTVCTEGRTLP